MSRPRSAGIILGASSLALVGVGAYLLGVHNTEQANWHTVTVDLANVAADETGPHRLLSIRADGWTYGIEDSIEWIDSHGTFWDSGWPKCLEPRHPGFTDQSHEKVRFRFAELTANVGDSSWRPVIMVDCRPGA